MKGYTVSQVARRTGLSVRALHHYEEKGLLPPPARSDGGYRLYGETELMRLHHIVCLKSLGLSLEEIRACLAAEAPTLAEALARQVERLREAIVRQHELLARLERAAAQAAKGETIDMETLIDNIEASTLMEKYFSNEQRKAIETRASALGAERIRDVELAWPDVIDGMRTAMKLEKDPATVEVQMLARRWRMLVREFTGGDPGIQRAMNVMFREDASTMQARTGIDPALMAYACRAIALLGD
jgi:DNA-binding transcriptional MerR regulator